MRLFSIVSLMAISLFSISSPALSQDNALVPGTYKLQSWRHDLGRPALYSYADTASLSGQCHAQYVFDDNGSGSFTGPDCKKWDFQWLASGVSTHEWISGVISCEKVELSYNGGSYKDSACVDPSGILRGGSDKFGQPLAYTKNEIL